MIIIIIAKIFLLCILCIYASVSDIRQGIIKNTVVFMAAVIGLLLDAVGWILFDSTNIIAQIMNITAVSAVSLLLYGLHIWAGGDCKLMIAIAVLVPYELYVPIYGRKNTLALVIAVIFGLSYLFLVADSVILRLRGKRRADKRTLQTQFKTVLWRWACSVAYILFINQLLAWIFPETISDFQILLWVINICIVFIVSGFSVLQRKSLVCTVVALEIVAQIVLHQQILSKIMVINYVFAVFFILLRILIDAYNYETIATADVQKGMILSSATTMLFIHSKVKGLPGISSEDLRSRLTEEEAASVRRWESSKYGCTTVQIVRKIPFAIFISIGTMAFLAIGVAA